MKTRNTLLTILAGGTVHSGDELGRLLGISRTAVWKHIRVLKDLGIAIEAVRGRGYRCVAQLELLSRQMIDDLLSPAAAELMSGLEIVEQVDSTNRLMMAQARAGGPTGYVCLSEYQTAGRGRRGRRWVSPYGASIYLSLLWRFPQGAELLSGLSLAVSVAMLRAIKSLGGMGLCIKWPNDLYWHGRKLAGVLLEMSGEATGPCAVVIGVGLNVTVPASMGHLIGQPWVNLNEVLENKVSRNEVAARLIEELLLTLDDYQQHGLAPFIDEWRAADYLANQPVTLQAGEVRIEGVARGIDADGALRVEHDGRVLHYLSGDVTLSMAS